MSDDVKKPDAPPATEAPQGESPVDSLDTAVKGAKSHVIESAHKAFEESFGKTWTDRLQIWNWPKNSLLFFKNFFVELTKVKEEKATAKDQAETEVAKAAATGKPADVADKLTEEMDKEAHFDPEQKEAVAALTEDVLEAAHATGSPAKVLTLISQAQENSEKDKKDPDALSEHDMQLIFSAGLFTLVRLKQRFPDQRDMEAFLTKVKEAGGKSAKFKRLSKYLALHFKTMFKVSAEKIPTLLKVDGPDLADIAGLALGSLAGKDKVAGALDIMLPQLFPLSVKHKGLPMLRHFFKQLIAEKKYPDPAKIAELTFLLEESDLRECARRIGGAQVVSLASVKETAARKKKEQTEASSNEDGKPEEDAEERAEAKQKAEEEQADKRRRLAA